MMPVLNQFEKKIILMTGRYSLNNKDSRIIKEMPKLWYEYIIL